jgi:branched-chain amino acid aminotransferase
MEGLLQLVRLDKKWVLQDEGCSLYIRPFMFSTEEALGVKTSGHYRFVILTSPTGPYYKDPVRMKIETNFSRAFEGGVGFTKAAGNYGVSLYPAKLAQEEGYTQIIWTDAKDHEYIEEAGMMNIMFVIGNTLITPSITGNTILAGITRDSLVTLAKDWDMKVEERKVSVKEIVDGINSGNLKEAFGVGTAATVALISAIGYEGKDYKIPDATSESFCKRAAKQLNNIRKGRTEDIHNWMVKI